MSERSPNTISGAIKALRVALKESQTAFAARFDVAMRSVARWEAGTIPHPTALAKLVTVAREHDKHDLAELFLDELEELDAAQARPRTTTEAAWVAALLSVFRHRDRSDWPAVRDTLLLSLGALVDFGMETEVTSAIADAERQLRRCRSLRDLEVEHAKVGMSMMLLPKSDRELFDWILWELNDQSVDGGDVEVYRWLTSLVEEAHRTEDMRNPLRVQRALIRLDIRLQDKLGDRWLVKRQELFAFFGVDLDES